MTKSTPHPFEHIVDLLRYKTQTAARQTAVDIVLDRSGRRQGIDWQTLTDNARRAAGSFRSNGLEPGDRVLIMLPTGEAFLAALFGALGSGLTPSSIAPIGGGHRAYGRDELRSIMATLNPKVMVSEQSSGELDLPTLSPDDLAGGTLATLTSEDSWPCYAQLSSGSTGLPKCIVLSWRAVRANLVAIAQRIPLTARDHMFSWLPMHHDMGLFGTLLAPLFAGSAVTLMDPKLFIAHPMSWFRSIADIGATITTTPPSALYFCLKILKRRPIANLDLSRLRKVICGAELVSPTLVREFDSVLPSYGVDRTALKPVYGLAENTLAVTIPHLQQAPRVERIEKELLEFDGVVRNGPADAAAGIVEQVSVGSPLDGVRIEIRDSDGTALSDRRNGSIWLNTPSLLSGVLGTTGDVVPHRGWLDTGDTGYMDDGELFVTGRRRDVIIKNGRNYSPERMEELATMPKEVYRAAAFGVFQESTQSERVIVVVEVRNATFGDSIQRDGVRLAVRGGLKEAGYPVDEVKLVGKGSLPRTSSGKIRRHACRLAYLEDGF